VVTTVRNVRCAAAFYVLNSMDKSQIVVQAAEVICAAYILMIRATRTNFK
jgi:hypothetical protein